MASRDGPKTEIAQKLQARVQGQWREKNVGDGGRAFFETILQPKFLAGYTDDIIWEAMTRNAEP